MRRRDDILDPRIRLRHLTCFLEVTRLKSVGRAAELLGVTQPAVSKTLHELEDILGVPLFDRTRRTLVPTGYGEVFLRYAGTSLATLKQGVRSLTRTEPVAAIGAAGTVSGSILPAAIRQFSTQGFAVTLRVVDGPLSVLVSQLRDGDVDLVIGRMAEPDSMRGLSFEPLYSEEIAVVVRPGHPLLTPPLLDVGALGDFPVLLPPAGSIVRPTVDRFLTAHAIGPFPSMIETVSAAFARSYVRMTDAIWIISWSNAAGDVEQGTLVRLPIDTSDTMGPVGFTTRTDMVPSLAVQMVAQAVRNVVAVRFAEGIDAWGRSPA
ncbi:pca operon transcription factor PcaQ [Rhodoplanes tepidamans]|nr:pca operon transcription factor PcaQ [Rhodoplanes tepidamans]